ncbi:hypothetical protein ASG87_12765 [Frateuria sp. Soil773]|uniref:nuclear transport factor 2 family protein n=1 Tax=Frateuria sp. Soil773 TaxID=1736407 RepID=UPI0006FDEB1C|nr:nuclear transport factor 2 family protein [Frateuria sp. Soil773]KRF00557.1 hypothetical protein ASG87_12765 [Frateuria sp. Soil773]
MRKQYSPRAGAAWLAALVLGAAAASAATPAPDAAGSGERAKTAAAVIAVDQHWLDAELDGDTAWLDQMLLPEYRSVGADGSVHPKAAILANATKNRGSKTQRAEVEAWLKAHPSGKSVAIHGDTAVLSFYDLAKGAAGDVRSSDVFVYIDGRWHGLYSQHSGPRKN